MWMGWIGCMLWLNGRAELGNWRGWRGTDRYLPVMRRVEILPKWFDGLRDKWLHQPVSCVSSQHSKCE